MKRIIFVCHGNICRSPMAEFIMKEIAERPEERRSSISPPPRFRMKKKETDCIPMLLKHLTDTEFHTEDTGHTG